MISRRATLGGITACVAGHCISVRADTPGVDTTEIRIGNTMPYSGPISAYGVVGHLESAFFRMVNENGGISGRKINFISYDDSLSPSKTVEDIRRLVEGDGVAVLFSQLGTVTNMAIVKYVNRRKIPHLFLATGGSMWGDYKKYPWTMGLPPSYRTEAQIYTKYIQREVPDAKIAILYQNDDLGKDYMAGVRDVLGDAFDERVVRASYETTDPTIDSQISTLQASGARVFFAAASAKFAAQSIRKVYYSKWQPMFIMANVSISIGAVLKPAGLEKATGLISTAYLKDPADPEFKDDPGMQEWHAFMTKHMPGADLNDSYYVYAYSACIVLMQVLRQCNGDFSRENIMHQSENLHGLVVPTLLPGIKVTTGPTDHRPIKSLQMQRWNGNAWVRFGDLIEGVQGT